MVARIQVLVDEAEQEAFRRQAKAEGLSLSAWLKLAAHERLTRERPQRIASVEDLDAFFAECDQREHGREPDWHEHLAVIEESRRAGLPAP